jgi:hypothetical protein
MSLEQFIAVLLLELADNYHDHRNYSARRAKEKRNELLKKYNNSVDAWIKDIVKNFNKKMGSFSDRESIKKLMDIIQNEKNDDVIKKAQNEFEDEVFNVFITISEFYQIESLHGDDSDEIKGRFFDVMVEDETYNHITKYFYVTKNNDQEDDDDDDQEEDDDDQEEE